MFPVIFYHSLPYSWPFVVQPPGGTGIHIVVRYLSISVITARPSAALAQDRKRKNNWVLFRLTRRVVVRSPWCCASFLRCCTFLLLLLGGKKALSLNLLPLCYINKALGNAFSATPVSRCVAVNTECCSLRLFFFHVPALTWISLWDLWMPIGWGSCVVGSR